ncbi:MAG TPA: hypothetical protein VM387_03930 [Gemmatimonadales bacterium]|nr:hypothetical protein [Gemmatimonadales bacterium]
MLGPRRFCPTGDVFTGEVLTGDVVTVCVGTSGGNERPPGGTGPEITGLTGDTGREMAGLVCAARVPAERPPPGFEPSPAFFAAPGSEKSASPWLDWPPPEPPPDESDFPV